MQNNSQKHYKTAKAKNENPHNDKELQGLFWG
jgi:hypothetical protein